MQEDNGVGMLPHVAKWATDLESIVPAIIDRHSCSASLMRRNASILEREISRLDEEIAATEKVVKLGTAVSHRVRLPELPASTPSVALSIIAPLLPEGWDVRLRKSREIAADEGDDLERLREATRSHCQFMRYDLLTPMELLLTVLLMAADRIDQNDPATLKTQSETQPVALEPDDVKVLLAADKMGARTIAVKSDAVHRKAFPEGEGTMPVNQRKRLKGLGLIKTMSGRGFTFTAKGIKVLDTQLAQK